MPADLDAAADELYGGAREDFTPRRKELAKEARTAGDTKLAAAIDKLGKPTTSAHLANQLARDPDADVAEVADRDRHGPAQRRVVVDDQDRGQGAS